MLRGVMPHEVDVLYLKRGLLGGATLMCCLAIYSCSNTNDTSTKTKSVSVNVAAIARTAPPATDSSSWATLRDGLPVFVGSDGGDATTMSICSSIADYDASAASCKHIKQGVPAVVDHVFPSNGQSADDPTGAPHVKIRAADGTWSGYTTATLLQARIPIGTTLVLTKGSDTDQIRLASRQDSELNDGPDLGDHVTIKVLHYYPDSQNRNIYAEVLDGNYAGKNGWFFTMDAKTTDGISVYGVSYDLATPAPTTDPMQRTYSLSENLRAFNDLSVCKAAFHAMESDDAHQQLRDAVDAGQYHDFPSGTKLHIVSDPDPNDLWVIVSDDNGNQGCVSRYNLPGYTQ